MTSNPVIYDNNEVIKIINLSRTLCLTWIINNICTNHCSYCPTSLHSGTNHHYDWNHAKNFVKECFERYKTIQCNLSGGEPTVSPFFKELVHLIYDNGGVTNLTTNLVRNKDWWSDIADKLCTISTSYHPEFMQSEQKENEFIEKVLYLQNTTRITVRVMMHPDYWDQCINFYNKCAAVNTGFCMEMVRILPNFGIGDPFCKIEYTEEQNDILNNAKPIAKFNSLPLHFRHNRSNSKMQYSTGETIDLDFSVTSILTNAKLTNFEGWKCNIGLESLFVMWDGDIQRSNCAEGGLIGNITKNNIQWPDAPIICGKNVCHCIADVLITKEV
jgi:organic radical activating enzyme